jgi:hypothetical protein
LLRPEDVRLSLMTLRWRKQPSVKRPAR